MAYHVEVSPGAAVEIEQAYCWIHGASPRGAHRWYNGLMAALQSLADQPRRCPLAPEDDVFEEEIRQLLYGRRRHRYRVLYTIHDKCVRVLHVRHAARRYLAFEPEHPEE